jgi:TrmH family RNA methyltransferase
MGAIDALQVVRMSTATLALLVRSSGGRIVAASPHGSLDYRAASYRGPTVVHVGSERRGVTDEMKLTCDSLVRIPMVGPMDSLNVAVAGSLLLYEVFRQRFPLGTSSAAAKPPR